METSNKNQKIVLFVFNTEIMTKSKNRVKNYVKLYKKTKTTLYKHIQNSIQIIHQLNAKIQKIHILKQNTQKQQQLTKIQNSCF